MIEPDVLGAKAVLGGTVVCEDRKTMSTRVIATTAIRAYLVCRTASYLEEHVVVSFPELWLKEV